jgi:hypothetical protein
MASLTYVVRNATKVWVWLVPELSTKLNFKNRIMNTNKNSQESTEQALNIPVVTCCFLSVDEKVEQFKKELKALLVKFNAELTIDLKHRT